LNIVIPYKPLPYQSIFHKDNSRFKLVVGGRRVGKSKCFLNHAIKHSLTYPNAIIYWVAPTYQEAREVGFDEFISIKEPLLPAIHTIHHSRLKVVFKNGSTMYFKGSDNPDSLRGRGLTLVIGDEAAFIKKEVWSKILRPALSDKKGEAILGSTPNGFNWFKDLYDGGTSWSKYLWPTALNPLITEDELLAVQAEISMDEYRQEFLAEFITKAGRVYDEFTGSNVIPLWSPDPQEYDIYIGMDFGYAHHTAVVFMAVQRSTMNQVIQFDEIYVKKTQMDDIINIIRLKLNAHNLNQTMIELGYTDPASNADELSSGLSPVDMLRNAGFRIINKGSTINAGIALTRSFIKNTLGVCRFFITENCTETIRSFNGYQYTVKKSGDVKEEPLKDNLHDHLMDAVRYFFVNRFDHAKYVADTPEQSPYTINRLRHIGMKQCNKCMKPFMSHTGPNEPPHVCTQCLKKD